MTARRRPGQAGFSLVELLVATLVLVVCLTGVALMILYGSRLGAVAREATATTALAKAQVERLRVLPRVAPQRRPGGSLGANLADHFERQGRYTTRWEIATGPAGTQNLTVVVIAGSAHGPSARLVVLLR